MVERSNIPIKNRMASSIPQLRKNTKPVKNNINSSRPSVVETTVKKKPTTSIPKKPSNATPIQSYKEQEPSLIQSPQEYPKTLQELLWKTPFVDKQTPSASDIKPIDYVDIINDLNSICFISFAPPKKKNTLLKTESQMNELQQVYIYMKHTHFMDIHHIFLENPRYEIQIKRLI